MNLLKTVSNSITWFNSVEGKIIGRTIASLGSFVVGDPTGIVFPVILESANLTIRKRFLKHFPDLVEKLNREKSKMNEDFFKSDMGQDLLRETINHIVKETNEEKIEFLKKFIMTSYTLDDPQEIKLKKYEVILTQMNSLDIQLLQLFCKPQKFTHELRIIKNKLDDEGKATYQLLLPDDLNDYNFKVDEGLFLASYKSLINWGLIQHQNIKLEKKDEVKPENTAVYTLNSYWGIGQADYYTAKDRRHARKILKENSQLVHDEERTVEISLSALTMAFVTNFGWEFMCMIDKSIQPISIDEDLELE